MPTTYELVRQEIAKFHEEQRRINRLIEILRALPESELEKISPELIELINLIRPEAKQ